MDITDLDHPTEYVGTVNVERAANGTIELQTPQHDYDKSDMKQVHRDGWGPFCEFVIDTSDYRDTAGVYLFTVNDEITYVGETENIHSRLQKGYGHISPANCFEGGQRTNCRVNTAVLEARRHSKDVSLWVVPTPDRQRVEAELINDCDPAWNNQTPERAPTSAQGTPQQKSPKYEPLYSHLAAAESDTLRYTFQDINDLLDEPLPASAYDYRQWWNPAGHSHAQGWEEQGWTVSTLDLNAEVVEFERKH